MLALTTCAALLLGPGPGQGPVMPEVRWEAPPGCPDEASVKAQIAALLARAPARTGQAPQVNLRVEALPGGRWRLDATITSREGQGRRSLEGDRCEALAEAAALLTAIAAAPELQQAAGPLPEEAPGSSVQEAPGGPAANQAAPGGPASQDAPKGPAAGAEVPGSQAAVPEPAPGSPAEAPETGWPPGAEGELEPELPGAGTGRETRSGAPAPIRPRNPPKATLGLGAGIGAGALPGVSALLRAAVGLRGRHWSVALTQSFWLPRDLPAAGDPDVGGRMWLAATGVQGCGIVGKGRVEAPLCAGVAAGVLRGRGIGDLAASYRATSAWAAATVGPSLHVRVAPRVALTLGAELLVMLTRVRFEVAQAGEVCCSAPVGATGTLGVEVRLP
ncbi:hypothetical protein OV090_06900 [Nannocystis sp. RBIL2]|uniref:hypothetical protein n=1 Tax=Nannocystis sp. RBIL2 TaxID=2996788 RepID=UPI0022720E9A|nr:hypothetical protein [Nannocystis sp. RBIL2]MCY1064481.1 hypothetical protein [Nannocystis sp. RBIL2]